MGLILKLRNCKRVGRVLLLISQLLLLISQLLLLLLVDARASPAPGLRILQDLSAKIYQFTNFMQFGNFDQGIFGTLKQ